MPNQLTIVQSDEASRWGADPYAEMVAAVKERQARQRAQEAAAQAAINAEIEAQKRRELNAALTQANLVLEAKARRRAEKQAAMNALVAAAVAAQPDLYNPDATVPRTVVERARKIVALIGEAYGLQYAEVMSSRRLAKVAEARQLSMYEIRRVTKWSYPGVGRFFGGMDHSTIHHGVRKIERLIRDRHGFKLFVDGIEDAIEDL